MSISKKFTSILLIFGMLFSEGSAALAAMNNGGVNDPSPRERCYTRCDLKYIAHGNGGGAYLRCLAHCKTIYRT
jgi:hypothetical protein